MNASNNLEKYGKKFVEDKLVAESWAETINACGAGPTGTHDEAGTEQQNLQQERLTEFFS